MAIGTQDLENRFGFHPATADTRDLHIESRELFLELAVQLDTLLPDGREKSLAITALEESSMWSNAAIARTLAPLALGE